MLGMFGEEHEHDCTTQVEDYRLNHAGDYMALVSSGMAKNSPEPEDEASFNAGEFEIFYGVQNSPGYKKKKVESLTGLGCGGDCNCSCNKDKSVSGLGNFTLGPNYGAWPPGPKPEPASWKAPNGVTWTLIKVDEKWVYQSSRDPRLIITTSNLYDLMGVKKDENLLAVGPIPGTPNKNPADDWKNWKIGGYGAGWVILGAIGVYAITRSACMQSLRKVDKNVFL